MTEPITTVIFVRHGRVHNPNQVYYGRLPRFGLSAIGREEARQAGRIIGRKPVSALYSSPMLRARQTADLIAAAYPAPLERHITNLLNEAYSPWDGSTYADMRARDWDLYTGSPPPYEQPADILLRSQTFIRHCLRRHPGETVIGVTHGDTVAFSLLWALGEPPYIEQRHHFKQRGLPDDYPHTASLTSLSFNGVANLYPVGVTYQAGESPQVCLR